MNEMLLVVMLAGRRAALPAVEVNSVIELGEVTPVPRAARARRRARRAAQPAADGDRLRRRARARAPAQADWRRQRAVVVEHDGHLYGLLVDAADDIVAALDEPGPLGADPGPGLAARRARAGSKPRPARVLLLDIAALIAGPGESLAA